MSKKKKFGWCYLCVRWLLLTDEDVLSTWLRRTLAKMNDPSATLPPKYVMPLCESCNHKLGVQFEDPAAPILKPLVRGQSATLSVSQQKTVASWAALKDLEYQMARDTSYSFAGVEPNTPRLREPFRLALRRLMSDGRPTYTTSVRIALLTPRQGPTIGPLLPDGWDPHDAALTSINPAGAIVLEGVICGTDFSASSEFITRTASDTRMTRIWPPPADPVVIKPTLMMHELLQLRDDLRHDRENHVAGGWSLAIPIEEP